MFLLGTLVTLHMHLEHIPRWIILYALSDMVQGYNTESLTLDEVGTVFGEFHTPCMSKTNFVDFEKGSCIAVSTKDIIRPYQTLHNSPMTVKCHCSCGPMPPSFLYIMFYILSTCSCHEYSWCILRLTLSNHQSIIACLVRLPVFES